MKRLLLGLSVAILASLAFAIPACGSDTGRAGFGDDPLDGGDFDGAVGFGLDGEAGGSCPGACSGDLHAVLDCNGNVREMCPPDKGCAAGACVAPCEAAAANKSSVGCDYFVYPPPFFSGSTSCTGAFIANTWGSPVKVTITRGAQTFSADQFGYLPTGSGSSITYAPLTGGIIPPGQVALVLLNQEGSACPPGTKSATGPVAVNGTGIGDAFRLQTD